MKKTLALVSVLIAVVFVFAACGGDKSPMKKEADVEIVTAQNEGKSPNEQSAESTEQKNTPTLKEENNTRNPDKDDFIGEERAMEIALEKAGLSADDVVFERVELDFDDGVWKYEVEFRQGRVEYDTDIKADDGTVLSWEKDIDD